MNYLFQFQVLSFKKKKTPYTWKVMCDNIIRICNLFCQPYQIIQIMTTFSFRYRKLN